MTWHWRICSPLTYLDIHWWIIGSNGISVTLNWHSGTLLTSVRNLTFISGVGSSVVSLYRGKQPRSQPLRWIWNWVASKWLKWHRSGSSRKALANWQSIDIFVYPLGEIWFNWIFSDTVTLQWHSGSALDGFKFGWCRIFCWNRGLWLVESSESWLLIGREDSPKMFKGGTLTIVKICHSCVFWIWIHLRGWLILRSPL